VSKSQDDQESFEIMDVVLTGSYLYFYNSSSFSLMPKHVFNILELKQIASLQTVEKSAYFEKKVYVSILSMKSKQGHIIAIKTLIDEKSNEFDISQREINEKSSIFESCNFKKGTSEFDSFYAALNEDFLEVKREFNDDMSDSNDLEFVFIK